MMCHNCQHFWTSRIVHGWLYLELLAQSLISSDGGGGNHSYCSIRSNSPTTNDEDEEDEEVAWHYPHSSSYYHGYNYYHRYWNPHNNNNNNNRSSGHGEDGLEEEELLRELSLRNVSTAAIIGESHGNNNNDNNNNVSNHCHHEEEVPTPTSRRKPATATTTKGPPGDTGTTGIVIASSANNGVNNNNNIMTTTGSAITTTTTTISSQPPPPQQQQSLLRTRQQQQQQQQRRHWTIRYCCTSIVLLMVGALVTCYAFVHVHIIQEDGVYFTTWFYEWFLIPVLLSFVFAAPLHRALGFDHRINHSTGSSSSTNHATTTAAAAAVRDHRNECFRRLKLLEWDPTTQRLVVAVTICYVISIGGDAGFFIPISPNRDKISTYPLYIFAAVTNIGFLYQGFLLTILTMRAVIVRLKELEQDITYTLQRYDAQQHQLAMATATTTTTTTAAAAVNPPPATLEQIEQWTSTYYDLRQDVASLSHHFGLRLVIGLTMFVVEVSNTILRIWDAVGSTLSQWQAVLLLLMYAANAALLVMVAFQLAYTHTICAERIGPSLAVLSLRTSTWVRNEEESQSPRNNSSSHMSGAINVLAQTLMQAPIHLRIGNFHVTAEYANALTAWFFGLFAVVFGMKMPNL